MTRSPSRARSAAGFTLVELLVVLTLLGVLGAMISVSISQGLEADAQARSRIEAFEDMQIAMERMTREIRAAEEIENAPVAGGEANRLVIQVRREADACLRYTYELIDGNTTLAVTEDRSTDGCATFVNGVQRPLLTEVDLAAIEASSPEVEGVFTYLVEDYRTAATAPDRLADDEGEIAFVEITLARTLVLDQRPVTVSTIVGLRNSP